jgi:class 3 adenylate cyclase/tetratricopeptide (TPR) repeat protein
MQCPECQFENREGAKFCKKCGIKLSLKCPSCGNPYDPESVFCDECGYSLAEAKEPPPLDYSEPQSYTPKHLAEKILTTRSSIEGERKLVTVFFADVANYTSLSEKLDPEEVHQIMDGCFKVLMDEIHKYEGTINQFTGDGVMALFGAPVAHEDHAQRACYAALAIQNAMGEYGGKIRKDCGVEFRMRIGLNSGPVIVGAIGDDLRMDYTAVGDTTNLASRMESTASPGAILASGNTHRLARDFFEFQPLGKIEVKGKAGVQDAYELLRAAEIETRIEAAAVRGLTRFVGRRRERTTLMEAFEKAQSGSGQVVGIVGEAGVGKSRLLLEFRNTLPQGEYTYLEGRCLHYGSSMAYLPMLDILRTYFEIKEGDREFVIKKKMEEKILRLDEKLRTLFAPFQEILSLEVDDKAYLRVDSVERKSRVFEALRNLLIRESQNKPLVLAIEDLHWIDRTSGEFLDYLIGWLSTARILLILLYRPEYTHQWGSKSFYSKIGVDQLSAATSAELVQAILEGGEVVPELRELILGRAGGNPLFVEELTRSLVENGSIQRADKQYVLIRKASDIQIPDTLQGIIAARIDRVEENLKRIMQVASVIGREFAFRILQTIMGMREELKSHLLNLQGLEFISEKRLFPELEYIFKHALTQEVAYNSLLQKRRKEIHEKIGEAIENLYPDHLGEYYELLAYHFGRSDNTEKALEYLSLANQKAISLSAMEDAMAYFEAAMGLLDTLPESKPNQERRISLITNQLFVFMMLFKIPEYYDLLKLYEPMAKELGNPQLFAAFNARWAQCDWWFGDFDGAIQRGTKAIEVLKSADELGAIESGYIGLAWSYLYKGMFDKVLALKEDVLRAVERHFNLRLYVYGLGGVSVAYSFLGRWDEAVKEAQEALTLAKEFSDNSMISFAVMILSVVYIYKGDCSKGLEYAELAVLKAPTIADKAWAQAFVAWALCRSGETRRGIEMLETLVPMYQAGQYLSGEVYGKTLLGEGYWLAGEYDKARQTLEESLQLADRHGMQYYVAEAQRLLGEVALETNAKQAKHYFEDSIATSEKLNAENNLALAYAGYGRLHKRQGKMDQSREYLTKALEIFDRLGTLIDPDKVRQELEELSGG